MTTTIHPIRCADGFTLQATLHASQSAAKGLVLLNPATAVTERLYAPFARHLAAQGFHAVTYNYRGMQQGAAAKNVQAGFSTWADQDVEAVTRWAAEQNPTLPLLAVGHSFGGHAIGLCESSKLLKGAVMITTHAGCLRFVSPLGERLRVTAMLKAIGPLCARTLGYVPGKKLGIGEDLPGQVMLEWSRWTSLPRYFFDDPRMNAVERFSRPRMPVLSIGFNDDPWAPSEAVDLVSGHLIGCAVERRQYGPEHSRNQAIGHMGFFRDRHADTLWPEVTAWLHHHAQSAAV